MDAVFAAWNGGAGSSPAELPNDVERFDSVADAAQALQLRATVPWPVLFNYINRPAGPSVTLRGDDCEMHVWLVDPTDNPDPYPDFVIRLEAGDPVIERA